MPDLAASYDVSADGLTYTFIMKDGIYFQDGTKVTADDVVFTVNEIKDQTIKSPRKGNWDGGERGESRRPDRCLHPQAAVRLVPRERHARHHPGARLGRIAIELNNANTEPIGSGRTR